MSQPISLKVAEQKAFRAWYNDGLWDGFLGWFFLCWAIAPYLSTRLGDFWSSAVMLPFWALAYLAVWLLRKYVVIPRIGTVKFGPIQKTRLKKFTVVMLVLNIIAFILGSFAALNFSRVPGQLIPAAFGLMLLAGCSLAATLLNITRLYLYGLLVGLAPLAGEWLWSHGFASHHGIPVTLGTAGGIMILVGAVIFIRLLHNNPIPTEETPSGEA